MRFKFVDELTSNSDYFRAMTYLKEIEFENRGNETGYIAFRKMISIHLKSNDFDSFDQLTNQLIKNYPRFNENDVLELKAETSYFLKDYIGSFDKIQKVNTSLEKKYLFRAMAEEKTILPVCTSEICYKIRNIELGMTDIKSSTTSLWLGIIPGLGQIYAGNVASGIGTFALTTFFTVASIVALHNDESAFAFSSITIGALFYTSSIYAGYKSTLNRNESYKNNQKKQLNKLPISFKLLELSF